ncbi:MAG: SRPBCC domain-containing protein [Rhizobiaceae bacterium]
MIEPVRKSVTVPCDPDTAFEIFTQKINAWWPLDGHSVSAMDGKVAKSLTLEAGEGGRLYEITADGGREDWGFVKVWEPGQRLVLAWHVMTPETQSTEVELSFSPHEIGTRVDLTHTGWEIIGETAPERRDSYAKGWIRVFETCYADACGAA